MLYYENTGRVCRKRAAPVYFISLMNNVATGKPNVLSRSPGETRRLGERLGGLLTPGSIIALTGELGCGKTLFTIGLCSGLGVPARTVSSPTFTLVNEYSGRLPVFHMDLYRLHGEADVREIGFDDYMARIGQGVLVVEWAEKIPGMIDEQLLVEFEYDGPRQRRIRITGAGEHYRGIIGRVVAG